MKTPALSSSLGSPAAERFQADFRALPDRGSEPPRIRKLRDEAMARVGELGFPSLRDEEWRYTSLTPLLSREIPIATEASADAARDQLEQYPLAELCAHRLVFINGLYSAALSRLPQSAAAVAAVTTGSLRELSGDETVLAHFARYAPKERNVFAALNTALWRDGAFVHIGRGVALDEPIHVLHLNITDGAARAVFPRTLVVLDAAAKATVIETHLGRGDAATFSNPVTEIVAGDDASIEHVLLQLEGKSARQIGVQQYHAGRSARLAAHAFTFGGAMVRNDASVMMAGEGIECHLNSLSVLSGRQHLDNHTRLEHAKPHCSSREVYKGILGGSARCVFSGRIHVWKDAQKTDAKQSNRSILLSHEARVDTQPQLEIYADDVKCTHGATVGQIDEDAVFYLQARGVPRNEARSILTLAFARDLIELVSVPALRERLDVMTAQRLARELHPA